LENRQVRLGELSCAYLVGLGPRHIREYQAEHCGRDPTSFSSRPGHCCRMKRLSTTRNCCVPQHAPTLSALPFYKPRLFTFSSRLFTQFCAFLTLSSLAVVCRALPHCLGTSQHRTFPALNLHRARVRRNHGRLPSNGSIERAQNSLPAFRPQ